MHAADDDLFPLRPEFICNLVSARRLGCQGGNAYQVVATTIIHRFNDIVDNLYFMIIGGKAIENCQRKGR